MVHASLRSFAMLLLGALPSGLCASAAGAQQPPMPRPVRAAPACVDDAPGARAAFAAALADLKRIHRARVAGPAGAKLIESRVNALLERVVDFDRFVDLVLGDAWDKADAMQRKLWRTTLAETLRGRYLRKLGSPLAVEIEVVSVTLRCDRAEVSLRIVDSRGKRAQQVQLQLGAIRFFVVAPDGLVHDGRATLEWRAFDVSVDGVSLLESWKSRFRRIYEDGGVAAIDHHMRGLRDRYGPGSELR